MSHKNSKHSQKKSPRTPRPGDGRSPRVAGQTEPGVGAAPVKRPKVSVGQARQDLQASGQQQGSPGMLIIALLGATLFMFFYLHILALPQMSALSGGLPMPDHRFSYGAADLAELDAAMDADAHGQLNWVHKTAGVIFPLFVFACVSAVAAWSLPRGFGRWASYAAGGIFAAVDVVENMLIERALDAGGEGAELASAFTSARWVLLVVLTLWVVLLIAGQVRRLLMARKAPLVQ
ncbi:hypothetical protein [Citricoccus nitrophenolicus]|uniref:hypothetical protein n=1 Tax=Citricoccus nitrophenolicus TaxID=863575 RepID=UPI0031E5A196